MKGIPGKVYSHIQSLKYRQKLILICILVGILPLIVMGVYCYRQTLKLMLNQEYAALVLRGRGHDARAGRLGNSGYLRTPDL